jgi:hypothetical protein
MVFLSSSVPLPELLLLAPLLLASAWVGSTMLRSLQADSNMSLQLLAVEEQVRPVMISSVLYCTHAYRVAYNVQLVVTRHMMTHL